MVPWMPVGGCTRCADAFIRVGELMLPARWLSGTKGSIEGLRTGRVLTRTYGSDASHQVRKTCRYGQATIQ
eukprot:COSAG01_NODE_9280_length_2495_cov_482.247078_2_plen_71_part_00